jgi:hypothetical protein
MNKQTRTILLIVLVLFLAACGGSAPAPQAATEAVVAVEKAQQAAATAPEATAAVQDEAQSAVQPGDAVLAQDFENAVSVQMQLLAGTFLLEGTPLAVTADQAAQLIPLWQMIKALTGTGTSAQAEIDAVLDQIQQSMTLEQIQSIREMQITSADYQAQMQALGISVGLEGETPGSGAGQGASLTEEERAARRATREASGVTGGGKSAVIDRLIELLGSK